MIRISGVAPIPKPWTLKRRYQLLKRVVMRKVFHAGDPPERIARGVSAGFVAAAMPIPILQIPVALACAVLVNGNRIISIFPQLLNNALTILPIVYFEFRLGSMLWPFKTVEEEEALRGLKLAMKDLSFSAPLHTLHKVMHAIRELGWEALGPLLLGFFIVAMAMALTAYPITVIAVWSWRKRRGIIQPGRAVKGGIPEAHSPEEIAHNMALFRQILRIDSKDATPPVESDVLHYLLPGAKPLLAQSVRLLTDGGQAFPAMLEAINSARDNIRMETYILRADHSGEMFGEALRTAAKRGVDVRLMYDAVGSMGLSTRYLNWLLEAGVKIGVYHPLRFNRPLWAFNRRNHRKILVVDGNISFTGGLNIADDYSPSAVGGLGWRDTHVQITGPEPARELVALFDPVWEQTRILGDVREPVRKSMRKLAGKIRSFSSSVSQRFRALVDKWEKSATPRPTAEGVPLTIVGNEEFKNRRQIRKAYLRAIRSAQRYIIIENAYCIPDRGFRRELAKAVRRGVFVSIVVSRTSDVALAAWASRYLYGELLQSGVRIFEWPLGMLHAKTAVIDDLWAMVGSYNLDHRSFMHSLEAVAVITDRTFAVQLRNQCLEDLARCHEVTWLEYESRPWLENLKESSAYLMRNAL